MGFTRVGFSCVCKYQTRVKMTDSKKKLTEYATELITAAKILKYRPLKLFWSTFTDSFFSLTVTPLLLKDVA